MILYYYTTTQTMQYILTNANIYATNMRYMNDAEEYINGLTELFSLMNNQKILNEWSENSGVEVNQERIQSQITKEQLEKLKTDCDSYSISFCVKADLLSQWSMYAKESGVSLTMDFPEEDSLEKPMLEYKGFKLGGKERERLMAGDKNLFPKPVYYFTQTPNMEAEHYQRTAEKILDEFFSKNDGEIESVYEDLEGRWKYLGAYIKRYDFYQEDEYRIVFEPKDFRIEPRIDYRNDKNVLKPYLDIECNQGWPVREITVGPGFNQDAVFKSIQHFLDHVPVKCQIMNKGSYLQRVEDYMKRAFPKWETDDDKMLSNVQNLKSWIENYKDSEDKDFVLNKEHSLVKLTVNEILECADGRISDETKDYFRENYFSVSGIVLKKSKIPYIF